ncbi:MAG: hypothetical protein Q7U10_08285 [Thermodesulfovibrionia bacterium]|nr:hypothetical protein [Thermodesulfovibrionia bacterium]
MLDHEIIMSTAEKISNSLEDNFFDLDKRKFFDAVFAKYFPPVDPAGTMEPYDAVVSLGRQDPSEFARMVKELEDKGLI